MNPRIETHPAVLPRKEKAGRIWGAGGRRHDQNGRQIADAIEHRVERLGPKSGARILDVATGTGWAVRRIAARGAPVTGIDFGAPTASPPGGRSGQGTVLLLPRCPSRGWRGSAPISRPITRSTGPERGSSCHGPQSSQWAATGAASKPKENDMVAAAGLATPLGTDPDFAPAHVAAGLPRHRRVGYLRAASAILDENGGTTGPERNALRRLAAALALPEASSAGVDEGRTDVENRDVDEIVRSFHQDPFRYALLKDMLLMVYAGGRLTVGRVERLANFAEFLGVPTAHMVLLSRYVEERLSPDPRPHGETEFFRVLAGGLEAAARRARSRAGIWSWFVGPKAGREIRRPKEE